MVNQNNEQYINEFYHFCNVCGKKESFNLDDVIDEKGNINETNLRECQKCGNHLSLKVAMHIENEYFNLIKSGNKTIETRIYDKKREILSAGDIIEFINDKTTEELEAKIIDLLKYKSFSELLENQTITDFGSNNKNDFLKQLHIYYSEEDERANGIVGIKIEILKG